MNITLAFVKKEFLQIIRDPSSLIIAFVLPTLLLFIYAYGINLDAVNVRLGIKNDDSNPEIADLIKSFDQNRYVTSAIYDNQNQMYKDIISSEIKGALLIPNDFSARLTSGRQAQLLLIADGAEINQVSYTQSYVSAIVNQWLQNSRFKNNDVQPSVNVHPRYWYNQNNNARWALVPSSLAVTMTLIGILLTALVISREWERGTMEALLSTNIKPIHIVLGKYIPYFIVGMLSLAFSILMIITLFDVPSAEAFGFCFWSAACSCTPVSVSA